MSCYKPGSPPRMRGKEKGISFPASNVGITPAYAGKSAILCFSSLLCWDHPRVCGEKSQIQEDAAKTPGSPPRMRGKEVVFIDSYLVERITPAYAGKSTLQERKES